MDLSSHCEAIPPKKCNSGNRSPCHTDADGLVPHGELACLQVYHTRNSLPLADAEQTPHVQGMRKPNPSDASHARSRNGFTLTEVLVVILIVAVLATVVISLVTRMRHKSNDVTAVLNMRQIGVALAGYMSDHQRLPRFAGTGVSAEISNGGKLTQVNVLQSYLGLSEPTAKTQYAEVFKPPGLKRDQMSGRANWYEVTCYAMYSTNDVHKSKAYLPKGTHSDSAGVDVGPFGRTGTGGNPTSEGWSSALLDKALQKYSNDNGGKQVDLSMVPAMMEINAEHPTIKGSWPWPVPSEPVRGDHVNVLYFDWHVGSVKPDYFFKP